MTIPPLLSTLANTALESKAQHLVKLDPFWREQLAELNGMRLFIQLTDLGFKRVIQFGPTNLHLLAPYTEADVYLITPSRYLLDLKTHDNTEQAIASGHIQLHGDIDKIHALLRYYRCHSADYEHLLAQILPDAAAYQLTSLCNITRAHAQQAIQGLKQSYDFWRRNEQHGH